jgi:hypothetical protein
MRRIVSIVALVTLAAAAHWPAATVAAPPAAATSEQLRTWLAELGDEDYARREAATQQLQAAGDEAIDVLAEGAMSASPEAAWRAGEALRQIAISGNAETIDRVAAALERVGRQGREGTAQVVNEIRARQKQLRHDRAAAIIRRSGGRLSGTADGLEAMGVDVGFLPVLPMGIVEEEELLVPVLEVPEPVAPPEAPADVGIELDAKAAELAEPAIADVPSADVLGTEIKVLPAREEIEEFRELESSPLGAPEKLAEPIEEAAEVAVDVAPEFIEVEGFDAAAIVMMGGFGGFGGEVPVEGVPMESLALDAQWRGGDKPLEALRDLPDIGSISIAGAKLSDESLKHIAALPRLARIDIRGTKFSVAALRDLHRAKPKANLFCQGEAMVGIHANRGGACVLSSVYAGSGAADAGLKEGDRIVAIDGIEIHDFSELTISVYSREVGDKLKVEYERGGKRHVTSVELKARSVLER